MNLLVKEPSPTKAKDSKNTEAKPKMKPDTLEISSKKYSGEENNSQRSLSKTQQDEKFDIENANFSDEISEGS